MDYVYLIFKSFVDPVFIIFILLLAALILCFADSKKKTGILILGLTLLLLYGLSIAPVANYLAYSLEKDYFRAANPAEKKIDVIVVLSGGAYDINALNKTRASEASAARLLYGVEMFNKYGAKYFVCAGKGASKTSEGEVLGQMALTLGVPKDRIRIDAQSNNTWEHAVELDKMLVNKNLNIGVVTSGYHMKRSEKEFKKYFRNVVPLPASYLYASPAKRNALQYIPQTDVLNATATALREFVGLIWYEMKGI